LRQRRVAFAPEAIADLLNLYEWIAEAASPAVAMRYLERLEDYCLGFDTASERGMRRDDVRPGLRIIGFERRVTLAFVVTEEQVTFLRVLYGGRTWE
jgi:toxin ParE1/3/4